MDGRPNRRKFLPEWCERCIRSCTVLEFNTGLSIALLTDFQLAMFSTVCSISDRHWN